MGRRQCGRRLEPGEKLPGISNEMTTQTGKEAQMPIRHTVRRGDSLWALACQYLGSGAKYPQIYDYHNKEVARMGRHPRIFPIKDPDLIYVSQIIMIPTGARTSPSGTGTKPQGGKLPLPVNLKVEYAIGRDTPKIRYVEPALDYTIVTDMSGKIAIEIMSADRYRHSLELLMSKDPVQVKQKLGEIYDPVLRHLSARPEMVYESGRVKIQAATQANMGPYTVIVEADAPNHLTGRLTSLPVAGTVEVNGRKYKYSAELVFKVEVFWHPRPTGRPEEIIKVPVNVNAPAAQPYSDWTLIGKEAGVFIVKVTIATALAIAFISGLPEAMATQMSRISAPLIYGIDPHDLRYRMRNEA
jgi:hypothetical protein